MDDKIKVKIVGIASSLFFAAIVPEPLRIFLLQ